MVSDPTSEFLLWCVQWFSSLNPDFTLHAMKRETTPFPSIIIGWLPSTVCKCKPVAKSSNVCDIRAYGTLNNIGHGNLVASGFCTTACGMGHDNKLRSATSWDQENMSLGMYIVTVYAFYGSCSLTDVHAFYGMIWFFVFSSLQCKMLCDRLLGLLS